MAIGRLLALRVETDAKAADHWYVPKGQAVNADNWPRIAEHLRVLEKFQTVPWSEAQPRFAQALLDRGLIEPYRDHRQEFSAVARMQFPVWRLLGLAWIDPKKHPEITEVGRLFVRAKSEDARRELLTMQLHRYQFYNPSHAPHFKGFQTFPVVALYRLMLQTDWKLTWEEFLLFGTRIRTFLDADELAQLVEEWRALTPKERGQLLTVAKTIQAESHTKSKEGTTLGKVQRDLNYVQAVLRILPTLQLMENALTIPASARKQVQRIVLASGQAEVIAYDSEQDWLAVYGQEPQTERWRQPWTTATEARAYYERVGRIDAATDAFAREGKGRSKRDIEEYRSVQVRERVLEDLLEHNLDKLEKGLQLVGRQYPTAVGPIDLLAKDTSALYVVIELKRGRTGDRVVGQIARYITWVVQRLGGGKEARVRGIVVGKEFDTKFAAAVAALRRVTSYTYDVLTKFDPWPPKKGRSDNR